MYSINIEMLKTVATGLGDLLNQVVFVGGSVTELYADNADLSEVRETLDIDCVVEIVSRTAYYELENKLRQRGFTDDLSKGAPIGRKIYEAIKVDFMPTNPDILGFSNRWYTDGIRYTIDYQLNIETFIKIFTPVYYLASKIEAFKGRGGEDFRTSKDFEDIIYLIDNNSAIDHQISISNDELKVYIAQEFSKFVTNRFILEGISCALPYSAGYERAAYILDKMKKIAEV